MLKSIFFLISATFISANLSIAENIEHDLKSTNAYDNRVSFDSFGIFDKNNQPILGNGSGDIVLLIHDNSGNTPRKKSMMFDLSFQSEEKLNDFTVRDIKKLSNIKLTFANEELTRFINKSKDKSQIKWSIIGIADHIIPASPDFLKNGVLNTNYGPQFINSGVVSTHPKSFIGKITTSEIKRLKSLISQLINANNEYEIESNDSLLSFAGEPPYFNLSIYGNLKRGVANTGYLNTKLPFGIFSEKRDDHKDKLIVITEYAPLGEVELLFDKTNDEWILQFTIN